MLKGFVKLSELNNDDMLLVGENYVISKEYYIKEIHEHEGVYTTKEYKAGIDAKSMLEDAIECEADHMYDDWDYDIWADVTEDDIGQLQDIVNKILSRSENASYIPDKRVEIDI